MADASAQISAIGDDPFVEWFIGGGPHNGKCSMDLVRADGTHVHLLQNEPYAGGKTKVRLVDKADIQTLAGASITWGINVYSDTGAANDNYKLTITVTQQGKSVGAYEHPGVADDFVNGEMELSVV